jgi:hypothetical protein
MPAYPSEPADWSEVQPHAGKFVLKKNAKRQFHFVLKGLERRDDRHL